MAEGVRYIKVAKIDGNGNNQTPTLQSLTKLTIPYSTGNVVYDILSISEQPNYFLYSVNNPNIEHTDRASLDYDFTGSINTNVTQAEYAGKQINEIPITSASDPLLFLATSSADSTTSIVKLNTYPQKDIHLSVTGSLVIDNDGAGGGYAGVYDPIISITEHQSNGQIGDLVTQDLSNVGAGVSTTYNFNLIHTIPSGSTPGAEFGFRLLSKQLIAAITGSFQFSDTQVFFTSSVASGPTISPIPEPSLNQDFSRAFDCQPTFNNVSNNKLSTVYQDVDYTSGMYIPTNFNLLINGSALKAEVQDSNYTLKRHVLPRYEGSKNQSSDVNVYIESAGTSSFGTSINIGTYGKTPSVSALDANIYEFNYGGGTTPEILGWGGFALGDILQVSGKDAVRNIKGSEGVVNQIIPYRKPLSGAVTAQYRSVLGDDGATIITPPVSVATSSIGSNHFWLTPQIYSDYYQILNNNNPTNHEISITMYSNPLPGSNPTIPKTTKVVTTDWGVPTKSRFALTSSNAVDVTDGTRTSKNYGFIKDTYPIIFLFKNQKISKVTTDNNGFYQSGDLVNPTLGKALSRINKELNDGERWFITLFEEFEFPDNKGDYNSNLNSGSLTPYNAGYSGSNASGNYSDPLAYKGVYEIVGTRDEPSFSGHYSFLYLDKPLYGDRNIGGNNTANTPLFPYHGFGSITGPSLGMLMWKARATGKNEFIMVQDEVTGGVAEGAFISKFATQDIIDNFDHITKTYGKNT